MSWFQNLFSRRNNRIEASPIFIAGCGHSGTSILLAILDAHSKIHAIPGETKIAVQDSQWKFNQAIKKFDRMTLKEGKTRWIEKTPNNIRHLEKILNWLPEAKILLIIRDGRDVALSIKKRTGSLEKGIDRWLEDNADGRPFWNHPNVHVLKYEDLITNFENTVKSVMSFLDEEYEPAMKDYHETPKQWYSDKIEKPESAVKKNHKQHRNWQINQPLFDGRGQWKDLSPEEIALINEKAGEMLTELGYS